MKSQFRAVLVGILFVGSGAANANLLSNGSFELGVFAPSSNQTVTLTPGSTTLEGWQVINDSLAWIGVNDPWGLDAQEGNLFLDLTNYEQGGSFGGVQQTFSTTPGYEYTATFQLGSSTYWGRPSALRASAAGQSQTFTSAATGGNNDWQPFSFVFVANDSTTTLSFVGTSGVNYIGLDNINLTVSAVPEPTPFALLLAGLGAIGAIHRKREK